MLTKQPLAEKPTAPEQVDDAPVQSGADTELNDTELSDTELSDTELTDDVFVFPTSHAQRRLWFLDQFDPNSPLYNICAAVHLAGELKADALAQTLESLVQRHESLRTTLAVMDGEPVQVVAPTLQLPLETTDLQALSATEREAEVQQLAQREARTPFDLTRGPLLRVKLLALAPTEHVLLLTMHHIISDGWSMGLMLRELVTLYSAFVQGQPSPLPAVRIQYGDFAEWQQEWLQGDRLQGQLDYWRTQLGASPPILHLPTDRPRPPVQTANGAKLSRVFPASLAAALTTLGQQTGCTLFMTLLAAWQTLLHRYTNQSDITVGTTIANRTRRELEEVIGFFVNTLVMRTDLSGAPTFRLLLQRVRAMALDAYAHQDLPFEKLVEELNPERNMSHTPLFQVMFTLQNTPQPQLELADLRLRPLNVERGAAKFDLNLNMLETEQGLVANLEYNRDLFRPASMERLLTHLQTLLESIVADPDQSIATLPLLPPAATQALLTLGQGARQELPLQSLPQRFAAQVERTPNNIAAAFGDQELTYAELDARAKRLAHYLQRQGIGGPNGAEDLVAVCMERSLEMMIALLGILKAGAAYLPLDPSYPQSRQEFMLTDAQPRLVLTRSVVQAALAETATISIDQATLAEPNLPNPEQLAYIIYTSGSTGRPKGTMLTHRGLANYLDWCLAAYPLLQGNGSLVHSTIAFDATITALFAPLIVGRTVRLLPEAVDIDELGATLADGNYSLLKITPAHLELLSHQLTPEAAHTLTKAFVIGGENLTADQVAFWQQHAPDTLLFNEYGPTENVVGCIVYEAARWQGRGSVPIGQAIPNTTAYVLDRHLTPVPIGVAGELYLGGIAVARGYLNRPTVTAEKFVPDPFGTKPGARLYRTGDLVRWVQGDDGTHVLEFLGRIDNQVKVRGYRIELGEIEVALTNHPAVQQAAVVVRADQPGNKRLDAYVATDSPSLLTADDLRTFLYQTLPAYMVPATFTLLERLPLSPNGKVDRQSLPAPEREQPYVAPRSPLEQQVAALWSALLNVPRVGLHDNFFALGGHSLLATQLVSRLRTTLQIDLPVRRIFEAPTVADLAKLIAAMQWATTAGPSESTAERDEGEI